MLKINAFGKDRSGMPMTAENAEQSSIELVCKICKTYFLLFFGYLILSLIIAVVSGLLALNAAKDLKEAIGTEDSSSITIAAKNTFANLHTVAVALDTHPIRVLTSLPGVEKAAKPLMETLRTGETVSKKLAADPEIFADMLGFTDEHGRNYLFAFQNNAELRPLGGVPSQMMLINVTRGHINVERTANSYDFPFTLNPDYRAIDLPQEFYDVYPLHTVRSILSLTAYPDFEQDAKVMKIIWQTQFPDDKVDNVMAFDPVGLSYLLRATGPIEVPESGDTLTSENAVQILLNDYYLRTKGLDGPTTEEQTDLWFDAAERNILDALQTRINPIKTAQALIQSIYERRLLLWFSDENEYQMLDGNNGETKLRGQIPQDTATTVNIPFYFWDVEPSKIDYYMDFSVDITREYCPLNASTYWIMEGDVISKISPTEAAELPGFIHVGDLVRTDMYAYAPENAEFIGWTALEKGYSSDLFKKGEWDGRYIARSRAYMKFDENKHQFVFKSPGFDLRNVNVISNPAINPIHKQVKTRIGCGN